MNKILFLLVVVAVPTLSFGGVKHPCEVLIKNLKDGKTTAENVSAIQADTSLNTTGISKLEDVVIKTTEALGIPGSTADSVLDACKLEVWKQTQLSAMKNRDGNNRQRSGGRINQGTVAAGLSVGAGAAGAYDLTPELSTIRDNSHSTENESIVHETGGNDKLTECNVLAETESCGITPFTASLRDLGTAALETAKILPPDTQHCSCIEGKARKEKASDSDRDKIVKNEVGDMNKMIAQAFSKKFINDYAAHLEDIRYFTKNAKQVFSSRESKQSSEADNLRCSKPSDFKAVVQKTCRISDAQVNAKMSKIFAELGQGQGFQYLSKLDGLVMMNTSDDGRKFKRDDFDIIRNGMVKEDKNILFADHIVATLLKDSSARKAILATDDIPKEGLLKYLTEQIRTDSKFFNRYLNKEMLGDKMFNEMSNQFKDTTVALDVIRGKLDWAMQVHPGFESLMKNKKIFEDASRSIRNSATSAINTLETSDDILKPDLIARCDTLKNNLAQFLCTDEAALVANTPKNELRHLIKSSGRQHDLVMADLAICRSGNPKSLNGLFTELVTGKEDRESDILERLSSKKLTDQKNLFTKIMLQNGKDGDDATRRFISRAAEEGYRTSRGLTNDSFGQQFNVADGEKMSFFSPETEASMKSQVATTTAAKEERTVINNSSTSAQNSPETAPLASPTFANNYSAAAKDYQETVGTKATSDKFDARNELREFLSNKENKESVEKLMKETDDSRVSDLARLRQESEKNREEMLKLATENEKIKLKQMQDQLAELEQKRAQAVSANVAPAEEDESSSDPRSSGRGSREIASVSSGESSGVNSGSFSGGKSGGSAGGSGSTSAISNARNELANGLSGNGETASEPVVISNAVARSGALEIKSTELSKEILNFLETEPDVQTLIKMRQSGMVYKYKVMENGKEVMKEITIDYTALADDVKKLIEQKIADSGKAGSEAKRLSSEIRDLRRTYSYNALKVILGEQMKAKR